MELGVVEMGIGTDLAKFLRGKRIVVSKMFELVMAFFCFSAVCWRCNSITKGFRECLQEEYQLQTFGHWAVRCVAMTHQVSVDQNQKTRGENS